MPLYSFILPDTSIIKVTCGGSNICFLWVGNGASKMWQRRMSVAVNDVHHVKPLRKLEIKLAIAFAIAQYVKRYDRIKQAEHIAPPVLY